MFLGLLTLVILSFLSLTMFQEHIAAAIMPSIAVSAVPRSPPPTVRPETSGLLHSSMLGKLFATPNADDQYRSETDTSLPDYENAKGTMP